jgi:integrase
VIASSATWPAGILKRDERGRTVDVHAMRHTFGTHLSEAGVPLRTAQAAMRHSNPALTANIYTDPKLLDVAGAVDSLPILRTNGQAATKTAKG